MSVKGIFQSELAGTSLSADAERDLQVQLFGFDHGAPTKALTPAFTHTFERPMGDLQFETISLLDYYEQLSALPDSFCVVIQNDGDDANYFAVGLDNSGPGHSWFSVDHARSWHPMSERRVGGAMLKGWNVMIRAGLAEPEEERTAAVPYPSFDYDYRGVRLTMEPPFRVDTAQSSCFAQLPDGQHVEGRPVYINGNNTRQLTYEFPVQLGGDYVFYNRAVAAEGRPVSREVWEWEMPDAYGFELGANYPNPFQGSTTVPFELLEEARVGAEIFDLLGRKVLSISSQQFEAGLHTMPITLQGVASGLYFVRMNMQRPENGHGTTKTTKMMLVR